jgi:hypothetical protein
MANGDAALAAGMDIVSGTADRRMGYDEINKSRDYIANRTAAVTPVAKGGTGATTAPAARTNLDVFAKAETYNRAQVDAAFATVLPLSGGTVTGNLGATGNIECNGRLRSSGSRNTPITTSYVAMYADGSGFFGYPSSRRALKQNIEPIPWSDAQLRAIPVVLFRYRHDVAAERAGGDPAPVNLGTIADDIDAAGMHELVIYDDAGRPESVRYELIGLAALALAQRNADRLDALEKQMRVIP